MAGGSIASPEPDDAQLVPAAPRQRRVIPVQVAGRMRIFLLAAIDRADASYWFTSRRMRRAGMGTGTLR